MRKLWVRLRNYLRVRGEYASWAFRVFFCAELPPRARRIPFAPRLTPVHHGTTSACAENTTHHHDWGVCPGELPPRARRIQSRAGPALIAGGTTSACAENTRQGERRLSQRRNYLRVRGEYLLPPLADLITEELPPRARRIQVEVDGTIGQLGTTSACAENTWLLIAGLLTWRNYLRVRGEYSSRQDMPLEEWELPPRARRIP